MLVVTSFVNEASDRREVDLTQLGFTGVLDEVDLILKLRICCIALLAA